MWQFDVSILSFCTGQLPTHWRLTIWLWLRPQSWLQSSTCVTILPQLRFRELSATRLLPQTAPRNWVVPWHRIQLLSACSPIDTTHACTERGPDIPGSFLKHVIRTAMLFYFWLQMKAARLRHSILNDNQLATADNKKKTKKCRCLFLCRENKRCFFWTNCI